MNIRTILAPYDFSEHAEQALLWAVKLAEQWQAKVIVMHALPLWSHISLPERLFLDIQNAEAARGTEMERQLHDVLTTTRKQTTIALETRLVRGEPVEEICALAEREPAELIVVGSHGRTGLAHVVLGSVAERVVRYAPCPVLVVRRGVPQ